MVKTFYLMRHGQTRFNVQGRIQGACDSPLTDEGIEQAKAARRYFEQEGISFTRVYWSTQERACDTAELATGRVDYIRLKKESRKWILERMKRMKRIKSI